MDKRIKTLLFVLCVGIILAGCQQASQEEPPSPPTGQANQKAAPVAATAGQRVATPPPMTPINTQ